MYEVESSFSGGSQLAGITESIHFNGANGISQAAHNFGIAATFPVTITFWRKRVSIGIRHYIFRQQASDSFPKGFSVDFQASGEFSALYGNGSSLYYSGSIGVMSGINQDLWNFYSVNFESNSSIVFRVNNGTGVGGGLISGSPTTVAAGDFTLLGALPVISIYSQQYLHDVRAYNLSLNSTELGQVMNHELLGTETAIAGNATGTTWEDLTGNGFDTTLSGSFAISTDIPT